ncbi:hypothetical protein TELCIR_00643 [Teladorsagia circumcincta]|uniref:Uncharacterized protein n=1 Tax=Teladorsagia circumcincta TaxID=45464 RepID=A0A2G9V468_TELCI|nr:hypothetical protein TELCIR_00643 [Teladorsagia circumcincta]
MYGIPVLLALIYTTCAQYGVPARYPVGGYGAAPPPFNPPIYAKPVVLPELPAEYQINPKIEQIRFQLWPYPHRDRHWRESRSRENGCDDCHPLSNLCSPFDNNCMAPKVKYFNRRGCEEAIVDCGDTENYALMTSDNKFLNYGVAIERVIKCRGGRWISPDIYGDPTSFNSLRCMKNVTIG